MRITQGELRWPGILILLVILYLVLSNMGYKGVDWWRHFYQTTDAVVSGTGNLYVGENVVQTAQPPWFIAIVRLLLFLPVNYGQGVINLVNIVSIVLAVRLFLEGDKLPAPFFVLTIISVPLLDLLIRTNVDGFALLGLVAAWWGYRQRKPLVVGIGFWLIAIKPIHLILVSLLILYRVWREWTWREKLWVITPLVLSYLVSSIFLGIGWGVDFVRFNLQDHEILTYLQTSFWRFVEFLGLPLAIANIFTGVSLIIGIVFIVRLREVTRDSVMLLITLNMVFAAYTLGSHYILLSPVLAVLMVYNRWYALLWLMSLTPFLRLIWGINYVWLDHYYVLALFISMVYVYFFRESKPKSRENRTKQVTNSIESA